MRLDDRGVNFLTKDGATLTLPPHEFIRRFLQHVLPHGFTKIRHYGLLAPRHVNGRLEIARGLLAGSTPMASTPQAPQPQPQPLTWVERLLAHTGVDPMVPRLWCSPASLPARPAAASAPVLALALAQRQRYLMSAKLLQLPLADVRHRALRDTSARTLTHTALSTSRDPAAHAIAATRAASPATLLLADGILALAESPLPA